MLLSSVFFFSSTVAPSLLSQLLTSGTDRESSTRSYDDRGDEGCERGSRLLPFVVAFDGIDGDLILRLLRTLREDSSRRFGCDCLAGCLDPPERG